MGCNIIRHCNRLFACSEEPEQMHNSLQQFFARGNTSPYQKFSGSGELHGVCRI